MRCSNRKLKKKHTRIEKTTIIIIFFFSCKSGQKFTLILNSPFFRKSKYVLFHIIDVMLNFHQNYSIIMLTVENRSQLIIILHVPIGKFLLKNTFFERIIADSHDPKYIIQSDKFFAIHSLCFQQF